MHLAFHSPRPQIVSLQSHHWFFWTNPSIMGVWKYIIYEVFCTKSAKNMAKECSRWKRNAIFGLTAPKYPYGYQSLFIISKKNFCSWKPLHSHSFGHVIWNWKLWVVLPGDLISLIVAIPTFCLAYPVLSVCSDQRKGLFQLIIFMWTIIYLQSI